MKYLLLSIFVLSISSASIAQPNVAAILWIKGEGTYTSGKTTQKLDIPLLLNGGDKIKLSNGEAQIILANSEEFKLTSTKTYIVPKMKKEEMVLELDPSIFRDYNVDAQNNSVVVMREISKEVKPLIYPSSSKIRSKENAQLFWTFSGIKNEKAKIVITDNEQNTICEMMDSTHQVSLAEIDFKEGVDYTWTINIGNYHAEVGVFQQISEDENQKIPDFELITVSDYLKAYFFFRKNEFYFDAYEIVSQAKTEFPDVLLFHELLNRMDVRTLIP